MIMIKPGYVINLTDYTYEKTVVLEQGTILHVIIPKGEYLDASIHPEITLELIRLNTIHWLTKDYELGLNQQSTYLTLVR